MRGGEERWEEKNRSVWRGGKGEGAGKEERRGGGANLFGERGRWDRRRENSCV